MNRKTWQVRWEEQYNNLRIALTTSAVVAGLQQKLQQVNTSIGDISPEIRALADKCRSLAADPQNVMNLSQYENDLTKAQKKLAEYENRRIELETQLQAKTAEYGTALQEAEKLWGTLWRDEIALLVRGADQKTLQLVTFQGLLDGAPSSDDRLKLEPWLNGAQRQTRRLFRAIELEPMIEERTFGDYRVGLDQCLESLQGEAASAEQGAKMVLDALAIAQQHYDSQKLTIPPNVTELLNAVTSARSQAKELLSSVGQPAFKATLADALRPLWYRVDKAFGTWQRRVKPSLILLALLMIVFLYAYVLLGSWFPSQIMLGALTVVAAAFAVRRYYVTRTYLANNVKAAQDLLKDLDPGASDKNPSSLWRQVQDHDSAAGAGKRLEDAADELKKVRWQPNLERRFGWFDWTVGGVVGIVGLVTACLVGRPEFELMGSIDQRPGCALARGSVWWAGPIQLVVNDSIRGLTVIPSRSVVRIQDGKRPLSESARCDMPSPQNLNVTTWVSGAQDRIPLHHSFVLPIFTRHVGCLSKADDGSRPDSEAQAMLRRIAQEIRSCAHTLPVILDVRGFASSREFHCKDPSSEERNADLAEKRRRAVISSLRSALDPDGKDKLLIYRGEVNRYDHFSEMKENGLIVDRVGDQIVDARESLARYVDVYVEYGGDCEPRPE